jgi:uncharacterized protein (DUF4415 family)
MDAPVKPGHDGGEIQWARGSGHLTRMNAVLRAYYEAHKTKA